MDREAQSHDLREALGLEFNPVAVAFSDRPDPAGSLDKQVSVCKALEKALSDGVVLNLSRENLSCIGGRFYLGLDSLPLSIGVRIWTDYHRAFASSSIARWHIMKGPKPPGFWPWTGGKRKKFAVIGPLEKIGLDPHVVLVCCRPEQADRLTGLMAFSGHGPVRYFPASNTCMPLAYPYTTGKPVLSFVSRHSREMFDLKVPPGHLFVSLPYRDLRKAVENIPRSGYGTAATRELTIKAMLEMRK